MIDIKTICFINQKGGVGKTCLCIWSACWLERIYRGKAKIIVIDLDHQPAATKYLHGNPMAFNKYSSEYKDKNICEVLKNNSILKDAIITKEIKLNLRTGNIDYIFGSKLCTEEFLETNEVNIGRALSDLNKSLEELGYDYVLVDCHPDSTKLEDNAVAISDMCIIPCIPEPIELSSMADIMSYCSQIPSKHKKRIDAVILNRCENKMVHKGIMRACTAFIDNPKFNGYFFKTAIESCTFVSQAVDRDVLLPYFKPQCKTSQNVKSAVQEMLNLFEKIDREGE